jgi:hypothetical protein
MRKMGEPLGTVKSWVRRDRQPTGRIAWHMNPDDDEITAAEFCLVRLTALSAAA